MSAKPEISPLPPKKLKSDRSLDLKLTPENEHGIE
jgi:hypothetical protein